MKNRRLKRDVSSDNIVELIQHDIFSGNYKPGQQLKQNEIAAILGVSQGPVREALIHLTSEGIVENIPFRGMFVRKLEVKDVDEIYQLRYALESLAVKLSLPKLKADDHIMKLQEFIDLNQQAERQGDSDTAVEMDLSFHRYIIDLSKNSRLIDFWDSLLGQAQYALRQLYEFQKGKKVDSLAKNHHLILDSLVNSTYSEICTVFNEHMDIASQLLKNMIKKNNDQRSL